ncbi:hypothetical protein EDC04DRAFT_2600468 [Pisolithus marmoratus]|nr:hypothetical protein EDC04DRAFT_2600468 [Pisolithus marmoratus]
MTEEGMIGDTTYGILQLNIAGTRGRHLRVAVHETRSGRAAPGPIRPRSYLGKGESIPIQPESQSCTPTTFSTALSLSLHGTRVEGLHPRSRSPPRLRSPSPTRHVKQEPVDDYTLGGNTSPRGRASNIIPSLPCQKGGGEGREGRMEDVDCLLPGTRRQTRSPSEPGTCEEAGPIPFSTCDPSTTQQGRERQKERPREHEQEKEREKEKKPTQPFLPPIPRYEPRPNFSSTLAYEAEYTRLDAHRANVSAEHRKAGKAWRRALHELDMATLELRAAQHRRELAENLRKRAHAGVLGIDATAGIGTAPGGSSAAA